MVELNVVKGTTKEKTDYLTLYTNALICSLNRAFERYENPKDFDLDSRKKIILLGVKMINAIHDKNLTYDSLIRKFQIISFIQRTASSLTLREFQTIFPIEKQYDGDKYGIKDYFYTRRYIVEFGEDKIMGEEFTNFLWEYQNWEINIFAAEFMSVLSGIRRAEGRKGLAEEFADEFGITTYTLSETKGGKKFLINNDTGETAKVKKSRPRYLKPL